MNIAVDVPQGALFDPVARIYGEPLEHLPQDLYIPPDALAIMLDAFEGVYDEIAGALVREDNASLNFAARHGQSRHHHYALYGSKT